MNTRIKKIRNDEGLNTRQFAEKIGVSCGAISLIENGKRPVTDQVAKTVCSVFGINEKWLQTGEGEMKTVDAENSEVAELMKLLSGSIVDNSIKLKLSKLLLHVINNMDDKALDMIKDMILELAEEVKKN